MILETVYSLLSGDAGVGAIASAIYPLRAPQGSASPFVVYQRTDSDRATNFDEVENFVATSVQVDSYALSYSQAISLSEAVKTVLNGHTTYPIHLARLETDLEIYEDDTRLYRVSQRYTLWHTET